MSDTKYKVKCHGQSGWRRFNTVRLEVSVGQDYHEGNKLASTIDWAKSNFERPVILLADRLQGYNIAFQSKVGLKEAFEIAVKNGDEWLGRNADIIKGVEVTRWSDWLKHPEYLVTRAAVGGLYSQNEEFRQSVQSGIKAVWDRRNPNKPMDPRFADLSEQFILEETAAFACAYKELKGVSAYPGDFMKIWSMFVDNDVPHAPEGLKYGHNLRLQFKRMHPQFVA